MEETLRETLSRVWDELAKYQVSFDDETDRGVSILAMCRFEVILNEAFKILAPDLKPPNMSLALKLYVGLISGLYEKKVYDGLFTTNRIRNKFAHRPDVKDFDHKDVSSRCEILKNYIPDRMFFEDFCKAKANREMYLAYIKGASMYISDSVYEKTGHRIWWHTEGVF